MPLLINRLKKVVTKQFSSIDKTFVGKKKDYSNNFYIASTSISIQAQKNTEKHRKLKKIFDIKKLFLFSADRASFSEKRSSGKKKSKSSIAKLFDPYEIPLYFSIPESKKFTQIDYLLQISKENKNTINKENDKKVLSYIAHNLKCSGNLKINQEGLVYVDLDDRFIHALYLFIEDKNIEKPNLFETFTAPFGAHINVILEKEYQNKMYIPIKEIGKKIKFFIKGLYSVENKSSFDNISKVWYLDIECKELEDLRYCYHLSPKLKAHNFLLPIAIKKETSNLKKMPLPEMKINISYHAA